MVDAQRPADAGPTVQERIRRDFAGVSEAVSSVEFVRNPDTGSVDGWPPGALLVRTPNREFLVDPGPDPEIIAFVADALVDGVMDDMGHPWPQLTVGGRTTTMTPAVMNGEAVWLSGSRPVCLVGELTGHRD